MTVVKRNGEKQIYDRDKLKRAIRLACAKRDISDEDLERIINNLESEWTTDKTEVSSKEIGDDVLRALKKADSVAYIRFASVYKQFDSLEDFQRFIK